MIFNYLNSDGTTATNITSFTSSGNVLHGVVVCSNVQWNILLQVKQLQVVLHLIQHIIQSDAVGLKGVRILTFQQLNK